MEKAKIQGRVKGKAKSPSKVSKNKAPQSLLLSAPQKSVFVCFGCFLKIHSLVQACPVSAPVFAKYSFCSRLTRFLSEIPVVSRMSATSLFAEHPFSPWLYEYERIRPQTMSAALEASQTRLSNIVIPLFISVLPHLRASPPFFLSVSIASNSSTLGIPVWLRHFASSFVVRMCDRKKP